MSSERVIVVGDFRQLGPIATSRSRAAFEWLHRDAYELVGIVSNPRHSLVSMLTQQRRMHTEICELINERFYEGRLQTETSEDRVKARRLPPLPGKSAVLLHYTVEEGSHIEPTQSGSRKNEGSAQMVIRVVKTCLASDPSVSIGVITPYRAQVSLIKRLLAEAGLGGSVGDRLRVGTIHAFQGSEADVIIWDLVETRHHPVGKLYRGKEGHRLVNVAISRAQGKLVIVGDQRALVDAPGAAAVSVIGTMLLTAFSNIKGNIIYPNEL